MKKLAFLVLCVTLICNRSVAQNEFLVSVNASNGTYHKIGILPEVNWINPMVNTYSQSLHRFYFVGSGDLENWTLYTVDAIAGTVVNQTVFPSGLFGLGGVAYSERENRMYALDYDSQSSSVSLVSFDPQKVAFKTICNIPGATARGMYAAIDEKNSRYLCTTTDSTGTSSCVIDISTGALLSKKLLPVSADFMRYDDETGLLYGLAFKIGGVPMSLISLDPYTCTYSVIKPMSEMQGCYGLAGYFTYDKAHKRYFYLAVDKQNKPALVTINAKDGALLNAPQSFPYANSLGENVICWQYDYSLNKFFALHWEPKLPNHEVRVNPNPITYSTTVYLDTIYASASSILYTVDGKKAQVDEVSNTKEIIIKRKDLASGEYYMKVYGDGKFLDAKKVVIE